MSNKELPDSLQSMIKDILANDEALKKVKQLDKAQKSKAINLSSLKENKKCDKSTKKTNKTYKKKETKPENEDEDDETIDNLPLDDIDDEETPKPKKQKRMTKKDKQNLLSKQYLEEVALGKLKFQDANGRNRTTTFKKWVNETKNPRYDDEQECWKIPDPDMYKQRVLAMKTCGSLFMKTTECSLTEMQSAVSYFLKALDPDNYANLVDLLQTPKIAPKIMGIMSKFNQ